MGGGGGGEKSQGNLRRRSGGLQKERKEGKSVPTDLGEKKKGRRAAVPLYTKTPHHSR